MRWAVVEIVEGRLGGVKTFTNKKVAIEYFCAICRDYEYPNPEEIQKEVNKAKANIKNLAEFDFGDDCIVYLTTENN
jgi:hypothetical protein